LAVYQVSLSNVGILSGLFDSISAVDPGKKTKINTIPPPLAEVIIGSQITVKKK
jgi:hypothetical protein